ncbi:putative transcription factor WD40-like family [Helianthus annuus]|uniref:Putative WD40/YVTN repeat-like-containing domain-containing protein n=1 Tax=Helianthus annuus TaxID=4232 RepID=A0A251ULB7_HELAN|nr:putative transcription factor WD40-like family [Helianthus annuus]KAJ0575407.1 putative transcription factor WD40-like family [Helianthus annuus]KAJ0917466.1 putative transcription factor WD40-like family [Helianthus annuus]
MLSSLHQLVHFITRTSSFSSCEFKVSGTLLSALSEPNSDTIPIQQVDEMAEGRQHSENSNPPPSSKSTTASEIHNMFEKGHHGPVIEMACHASGGLLVTAGANAKILVCFFLDTMIHTCLLCGGRDQVVNLWNLQDYNCTSIPTNEAIDFVCVIGTTSSLLQVCKARKLVTSQHFI